MSCNLFANDLKLGQAKADANCAVCHGAHGVASLPNAPNLAGQQALYIAEQLKNYKNGKRQNEVMNIISKNLSDTDIAQISAWYASIKFNIEIPQ